jgi:hypothetical protein
LIIFFYADDDITEIPLKLGVRSQIRFDGGGDSIELSLNDALFRFPSSRQKYFPVASPEGPLCVRESMRAQAHGIVERPAERQDQLMTRAPREIEQRDQEHHPDAGRGHRIGRNSKQIAESHCYILSPRNDSTARSTLMAEGID